jgi:hypothetical protein
VEANPALQRLVQAQLNPQKIKKPLRIRQGGGFLDSSTIRRQERDAQNPDEAMPNTAGHVAQLVRSLLAARDIGPARIDKESIEKLRVRGSKLYNLSWKDLFHCQPHSELSPSHTYLTRRP